MAGMLDEFSSHSPLAFDFTDGLLDDEVAQKMRIPQKITVAGDEEEYPARAATGTSGAAMTSSMMAIPERIEIGNFASPTSEIPKDLRGNLGSVQSKSSMVTPPRTLTVDDTKSAHYPQRIMTAQPSPVRGAGERGAFAAKFVEDESIAVGLEVIEEGTPLDSDSEVGHYMGNDLSDTRKCLIQVQQLNRRVRDLERDLQRNTVGFWSKLAFFAFTIINPIILHWLLWKRR